MPRARALVAFVALAAVLGVSGVASAQYDRSGRRARATQLRERGDAYLAAGDRMSALGWYRDAVDADPSDGPSYAALGRLYLERGALADARAAFEAGVSRASDHVPLWLGLAETLERMGSAEDAARAMRELTRRTPRDPASWRARAELAKRRGAWSEALSSYRTVITLAEAEAVDPELIEDAGRNVVALRFLVGTLDPARRGEQTPVRRALSR